MSFLLLDDGFAEHPKLRALDDASFRAHVRALLYCKAHQTDLFLPDAEAVDLAGRRVTRKLVTAGLWRPIAGGYAVSDFLVKTYTAAQIEARRKAQSSGGKLGNLIRWGDAERDAERDADRDARGRHAARQKRYREKLKSRPVEPSVGVPIGQPVAYPDRTPTPTPTYQRSRASTERKSSPGGAN